MTDRDLERRLRRLPLPSPRADLREEVLRAASAAALEPRTRAGVAERLWFSRGWRWAWAAAVAVLLLAEGAVQRGVERRFEANVPATANSLAAVADELGLEPGWRTNVTPARERPDIGQIWDEAR